MVLTPHAEARASSTATALLDAPRRPARKRRAFHAADLDRSFTMHATDHVLAVLGPALDRVMRAEAPRAVLRVLPTAPDDAGALRAGTIDLAIGIYGELPPEMRTRLAVEVPGEAANTLAVEVEHVRAGEGHAGAVRRQVGPEVRPLQRPLHDA